MKVLGRLDIDHTRLAVMQRCGRVAEARSLEGQFQAHVARMTGPDSGFDGASAPMYRNADGTITIAAEQVQMPHYGAFAPDHALFRDCLLAAKPSVPLYAMVG